MNIDSEDAEFYVVYNDEEQYSIWPTDRPIPAGWYEEGTRGPRSDCLDRIETVWTDMRPKSVRQRMTAMTSSD